MSLVYFVVAITGLLTIAIAYVLKKYAFWADRDVPHVSPTFPNGNFAGLGKKFGLQDVLQNLYTQLKPTHAKFAGVYFFISPTVLVLDLDFVKTVLIKDFEYFHDRGLYSNVKDDPLTGHLFLLEGQKWKKLRNKLTPTFTSGKMKFMFPTIVAVAQQFRTAIGQAAVKDNDVNIRDLLARFTTDVIGTCAFGIECNSLEDPDAEFRKYGKKIFGESVNLIKALMAAQFQTLARALGVKVLKDDITKFFLGAIESTIEAREKQNIKRNDFLNMMIDLKNNIDPENQLTVREIAAQAFVFFVAGFETSSSTMSFALFELAQNENLQDKARASVQVVLEKHNGEMTYEAIMEMTYLSQCINGEPDESILGSRL
jgi:cytochrome P450 family 6